MANTEPMDVTDSISQQIYTFYTIRRNAFDTWPTQIVQNKNVLSKAGFYHSGPSD